MRLCCVVGCARGFPTSWIQMFSKQMRTPAWTVSILLLIFNSFLIQPSKFSVSLKLTFHTLIYFFFSPWDHLFKSPVLSNAITVPVHTWAPKSTCCFSGRWTFPISSSNSCEHGANQKLVHVTWCTRWKGCKKKRRVACLLWFGDAHYNFSLCLRSGLQLNLA